MRSIPKLPFASPNEPLVKSVKREEDRAWWRYSLPEADATKQAAGRLIRSARRAFWCLLIPG